MVATEQLELMYKLLAVWIYGLTFIINSAWLVNNLNIKENVHHYYAVVVCKMEDEVVGYVPTSSLFTVHQVW